MNKYNIIDRRLFNMVYNLINNWNGNKTKIDKNNNYKIKKFINYILSRKIVTYNNMLLSLYYLSNIKRKIKNMIQNKIKLENFFLCGRRMFLISLIISNKYIYDKSYKNVMWSKITGLKTKDINFYEIKVLKLIEHNLYISDKNYNNWKDSLIKL